MSSKSPMSCTTSLPSTSSDFYTDEQKEMMREKELLRKEQELIRKEHELLRKEQELRAYEARLESKSGSNFLIQLDLAEAEDDVVRKEKELLSKEQELLDMQRMRTLEKERLREELMQELRLEEEAKRKEEAAKRKEEAERVAKEKEEKEMKELYNETHSTMKFRDPTYIGFQSLLKVFEDNDEFHVNGINTVVDNNPAVFITNKNVYYTKNYTSHSIISNKNISKMYTFATPLNSKYIRLIMKCYFSLERSCDLKMRLNYEKYFEATVKYIPGSYQNGPWKQLDGFFGPYLNEETMELVYEPPQ